MLVTVLTKPQSYTAKTVQAANFLVADTSGQVVMHVFGDVQVVQGDTISGNYPSILTHNTLIHLPVVVSPTVRNDGTFALHVLLQAPLTVLPKGEVCPWGSVPQSIPCVNVYPTVAAVIDAALESTTTLWSHLVEISKVDTNEPDIWRECCETCRLVRVLLPIPSFPLA